MMPSLLNFLGDVEINALRSITLVVQDGSDPVGKLKKSDSHELCRLTQNGGGLTITTVAGLLFFLSKGGAQ